jgi:coenzyme F420 hydrogenase subunit delta
MSEKSANFIPTYLQARCLVLGCGNLLFGDDGFGPAVAERLLQEGVPEGVQVLDAGTGIRTVLFNILISHRRPELVIVVDAVDRGREPGEVFWLDIEDIPAVKTDDFSMHQAPTSNLLRELREKKMKVEVLACQSAFIPEMVDARLSPQVAASIPVACRSIRERLEKIFHQNPG